MWNGIPLIVGRQTGDLGISCLKFLFYHLLLHFISVSRWARYLHSEAFGGSCPQIDSFLDSSLPCAQTSSLSIMQNWLNIASVFWLLWLFCMSLFCFPVFVILGLPENTSIRSKSWFGEYLRGRGKWNMYVFSLEALLLFHTIKCFCRCTHMFTTSFVYPLSFFFFK